MPMRTVRSELEAKMRGVGERFAGASGKLERKSYGDSTERLKIRLSGLEAASSGSASVIVGGVELAQVSLSRGRGRYDVESSAAVEVPALSAGQEVRVLVGGELALAGKLAED